MSESKPMSIPEVKKLLKRNKKKVVLQTIENCLIVLRNDATLQGAIRQNILTDRQDIVKDVGWVRSSTSITDTDYQYIMHYLEHNYGLSLEKKIQAAVKIIANENQFHPIRDYLSALRWDGEKRLPYTLSKYLGAEPCAYTTEVLKVFMLGAVSRVFQPGIKFDYMLCLAGGQGAGKSTFFRFLALKDEWFTDDLKHIDKDDVYLQMQGHWIIEMSEMLATANAKSIEEIKSFISRLKETYRTPYDKFPNEFSRQFCGFLKNTNEIGGEIEMNDNIMDMNVMNMKQTVERAKASGINISEYTLRRAIRMKELPCKVIGRTYLIHWDSFLRWISCEQ